MSQDIMSLLRDDPVLGRYVENTTPPVKAALAASEGLNTERLVRERELSSSLGIPVRLIRGNMEKAEQEDLARRIQADPVLGRYAGLSPENAALVRDDEQGLLGVIRAAASAAWESTKEAGRDIGEAWDAGNRQMELAELGNRLADGDESAQAEIDARYAREASLPQRETFADTVGLTSAVTQLPRTLKKDAPTSALYALGGALLGGGAGAAAGSVFPGVGTATGGLFGLRTGGKAGWLAGTAKSSYDTERGSFAAELSQERDENGQRLAPEIRDAYSTLYGAAAAAVETAGEAVFMKLISPLAGRTLSKLGVKPFLRSALKTAMWDKGVQAAVLDLSKRFSGGVAGEGAEEAVQQLVSILAESTAKREATAAGANAFRDEGLLPPGSGKEALEAGVEGMKAGLWLSGGPTVALGVAQVREARRVAAWSQAHKDTKAALDQTKIGAASSELSEAFLRRGKGITGTVTLPANAVLELHQSGLDILEPMGWQARDVADAAALGQDLEAPLSRLHARLDAKALHAVADIMRPEPGTMNAAEAARVEELLAADVEDVNAAFAEYQAERNAIDAEVELLRAEVAGAVASVPNLDAAVAGAQLTPEATAETYVAPLLNFAERLQEHAGLPVAQTLRKLRVQGLVRDGKRLLTPDEMLEREEARAKAEAERPFWGAVWGRLDGQSLKRDYPDAYRELSRLHGPGLFAKKGGGLAIDELADEMEGAYLLEQGGGGDALMERLKQGKRPERTLFQPLNAGVDLDAPVSVVEVAPRFAGRKLWELMKGREAAKLRRELPGVYHNAPTGWDIRLTVNGVAHAISSATRRGMGGEAHMEAVAGLPGLIENAVLVESHADRKGQRLAAVHRMYAPMRLGEDVYAVKLTVKESDAGMVAEMEDVRKLYDLALEKKMPGDLFVPPPDLVETSGKMAPTPGISEITLRQLLEDVKDSEGQAFFQKERSDARGSIKPTPEGRLIQLYAKADLSTLLHEMGHFFLLEVNDAVRAGLADDTLTADYATLRQWLKAEDGAELTREQHEQFARGFEAYLMEGKAPSASLESAFARFKKWLTRIYKKARALNVDLTDEVRGVFDRLLASEAEMNAKAVENGLVDLTARELDALGLKGAERISVSGLMRTAVDAAGARMRADRDRQRQEQVRQWAAEAKAEVDADPLYGAMKDARAGGLDLEAVRQDMGEDYAARLMKRLPGAFRKEGGADPAMFAAEHGFRDPAAMFKAMLDAPKKGDLVRKLVDDKQQAWDANFDPADYLLETEEAARHMERVGQYVARALGKGRVADQQALKRVAAAKLAAMSMGKATQPGAYRMNMRRALAAERRAIVKGDWEAALEANFQARINMEFARQSRDLKRSVETLQERIKRFTSMAKADPDARFLVGALAQRHGLGRLDPRLVTEERTNPGEVLAAWIKEAEADGCPVIMDNAFARPDLLWRDMSVEAFEEVAETVRQIVTVERNQRKLLTARNKADLDAVAEEIALSVAAFRKAASVKSVEKENAALKSLKGLHAIHTKVEALCLALDGDKQGPMWEYIYRPITKAEDGQSGRFRTARDELRGLFGVFSRKELSAMRLKREYVDSVGERLTRENMLALALNMGNETNIQRIREGHKWTDAQISDVLSRLSRKDWEFVQSVWDYFETFRDESFQLQEDITGLRPQAVEAKPLTVTTADGHTLTLRGGYFPIKYNADKGFMAYEREQRQLDKEFFGGNSHSAAQTRQGHLKERAGKGVGEPLLLELSVVTDHVFNVIHDLSYRRAVLDVAKVIRHPKVRDVLTGAVGMDMYNQLKPWLMDVANERQEPMHAVHRWANWARRTTSIMQMGLKVTTMLAQPLGITQTAEVLGYGYTAAGLKKVYSHPLRLPELLEETFARSPMMADRIRSFDREIRDMTKKLMPSSGLFGWVDTVRDSAFVPIGVMQMGVDLPTWWGGYAKGLRDFHGDEARAAEYADSVVRLSQGSGSTKDLARVQRGGPLPRLFTMFYSYFNTFYNLSARRFTALRKDRSPAAIFRAANTALLLWFVPAVLGELMAGRGPDDDDEWGEWAEMQLLQYPFQAVVGVRDVANHVFGEYGYQITPAQAAPKALGQWFKSVNKALEEEDAGRLAKPTVEAAGYLFGLPMKQPIITVGNIWDYLTGEDPEFEVRDLFFTKPKDRR